MMAQEFLKLHDPKINKHRDGYSAMANLIFQLWLKGYQSSCRGTESDREAIQMVKDFTAEHAHDEEVFYMGMVVEDQQTFEGLVEHLKNAFQPGQTLSELIGDFNSGAQKRNESEDVLADDLQILV